MKPKIYTKYYKGVKYSGDKDEVNKIIDEMRRIDGTKIQPKDI